MVCWVGYGIAARFRYFGELMLARADARSRVFLVFLLGWLVVRIVMVIWEYFLRVVGGIFLYVGGLSRVLARVGYEVVVLMLVYFDMFDDEVVDGVRVLCCYIELFWFFEDNFFVCMASLNY